MFTREGSLRQPVNRRPSYRQMPWCSSPTRGTALWLTPTIGDGFVDALPLVTNKSAGQHRTHVILRNGSGQNIFDPQIRHLRVLGITIGCYENAFCPDDSVTRGQLAAFLVRSFFTP